MRNRRLTISALALILMTGCGEDSSANPAMVDLAGTWSVQSYIFTSVLTPATSEDRLSTAGGVTELTLYLYNDGTLLSITFFADPLEDPDYDVDDYCVSNVNDDLFCEDAGDGVMILNEEESDELILAFTRNGDDMTLSGTDEYNFGAGDEDATFVIVLERIVIDYNRPPLSG